MLYQEVKLNTVSLLGIAFIVGIENGRFSIMQLTGGLVHLSLYNTSYRTFEA